MMKIRLVAVALLGFLSLAATSALSAATAGGTLRIGIRIGDASAAAPAAAGYDGSVRHALIASGTPRGIALASLPAISPADESAAGDERLFRAATLAADDVLVQWLAANRFLAAHDDARAAAVIATLTRLEPDNAAAWALALSLAARRGDSDAVDRALARMAASTRADEHVGDALHAWLDVYERHPRALSAFANPAEAEAAPFIDAMSRATAAAMTSYQAAIDACDPSPGPARTADCAASGRLMLHRATSLSARKAGFAMLHHAGVETAADVEARRELAWIAENAARASGFSDLDRLAIEAHREDWRALDDEYEILRRAMRRAGLPEDAPVGWIPARASAFALAVAG
ncbi:MAG TPA: hypothetical protein VJ696_02995 [Rhodanobacteraceae bacterium]|nr:hypothetical protein [Rhodanobacteraceae bacterium]